MRRSVCWLLAGFLACLGGSTPGRAQEPSPEGGRDLVDETIGRYHMHPAFDKLGRGVSNALLGWLEIPLTMQQRYEATTDKGAGLATGVVVGVLKGVTRTVVGAYETLTFFLPYYPDHYAPILPPVAYVQKHAHRQRLPLE